MNKITVSFECDDKLDADQMTFAFEVMNSAYVNSLTLFGDISDLYLFLDHVQSWIWSYENQNGFERSEIDQTIKLLAWITQSLEKIKSNEQTS